MRPSAFTRVHAISKEEKELRLKEFIARDLEARKDDAALAGPAAYRLVALSIESPVVRALGALASEITARGIAIEVAFLCKVSASDAERTIPGVTCRVANDRRLFDAHEQLVLSAKDTWTGDCMRRVPTKRDSYECYSINCIKTADWAASSFARIWALAKPAGHGSTARKPVETPEQAVVDASLIANPDAMPDPVALRH
jgi:hypothetical protein